MPELNEQEYAIVMQALSGIDNYIDPKTEEAKMTKEAIQVLKSTTKGNNNKATPQGGSYISKDEKLKNLMQMFGIK